MAGPADGGTVGPNGSRDNRHSGPPHRAKVVGTGAAGTESYSYLSAVIGSSLAARVAG